MSHLTLFSLRSLQLYFKQRPPAKNLAAARFCLAAKSRTVYKSISLVCSMTHDLTQLRDCETIQSYFSRTKTSLSLLTFSGNPASYR